MSSSDILTLDNPTDLHAVVGKCLANGLSEVTVNDETIDHYARTANRPYIMYNGIKVWRASADQDAVNEQEDMPAFKRMFHG